MSGTTGPWTDPDEGAVGEDTPAQEDPGPPESALGGGLGRLKALGTAFAVVAALAVVLPGAVASEAEVSAPLVRLLNVGFAASGAAVSVGGILVPQVRRRALLVGPGLLVAAAAASPVRAVLGGVPPQELTAAFLFAASWLLTVEHMHALVRFSELGRYASRQRLSGLDLGGVVGHFIAYGLGLAALIVVVTALVALAVPWAIAETSNAVLANSTELSTVWGIALASAIVFGIGGLILTFKGWLLSDDLDVERVPYSRRSIEEMLGTSRQVGASREPSGGHPPDDTPPALGR